MKSSAERNFIVVKENFSCPDFPAAVPGGCRMQDFLVPTSGSLVKSYTQQP
jgi:hypothetical protein